MLHLHVSSNRLQVIGTAALLNKLENYPGANRGDGAVTLPFEKAAILCAEAIGYSQVSEEYAQRRRTALRPSRSALCDVERRFRETGDGDVPHLLLHQWEYLAHHLPNSSSFNTSEQGLGKTRMALALMRLWGCNRMLLLLPKGLAAQWEADLKEVWPGDGCPLFIDCTSGPKAQRAEVIRRYLPRGVYQAAHPIILAVNYDVLTDLEPFLKAFWADCTVADESWKIKNPRAKVTKCAIKLADHSRAHYADKGKKAHSIALAGTPIGNDVGDLWSQLRFLGRDLAQDSYQGFLMKYAELAAVHIPGRTILQPVGVADPAGLMMRVAPVWFRATKSTCLNLPQKVRQVVKLSLPSANRALYDRVEAEGEFGLGDELSLNGEAITILRLQQITGGFRPHKNGEDIWQLEPLDDCPKRDWLEQWAQVNLAPHPATRAIVWCRFRAEVREVSNLLGSIIGDRVVAVDGDTSSGVLDGVKRSFNSRDDNGFQVIVATTSKLAYGHNLQAADWMVYFSGTWSYIEHAQSEDRAHRYGREADVNYVHLLARDTVDEQIYAALEEHRDVALRLAPCVATPRGGG